MIRALGHGLNVYLTNFVNIFHSMKMLKYIISGYNNNNLCNLRISRN